MTSLRPLGRRLSALALLLLAGTIGTAFGQAVYVVYAPNQGDGTVSGYTINTGTGVLTQVSGSPYSAGFTSSNSTWTAVTPDHRFLYVSNADGSVFGYQIKPDGTLASIFSPPITVTSATGITVDSTGNYLYVAQKPTGVDGSVTGFRINQTTGGLTALSGSPFALGAGSRGAQSVAISGNFLYVVLAVNNAVELMTITPATGVLTAGASTALPFSDIKPGPVNLTAPFDIKIDGSNHLYVSDAGFFNAAGSVAGLAAFTINTGTGALTPTSTPTYATGVNPFGLAIDPTSKYLYVANNNGSGAGSISAFTIGAGTGNLTAITGSPFTTGVGTGPAGVAADLSGNFLYVTNSGSNTISGFRITQSGATAGALTFIAATASGHVPFFLWSTIAPGAPTPTAVPAASTWSLVALGVLLATFSALLYRKAYR
jgi:6-phosphogluconolactonase